MEWAVVDNREYGVPDVTLHNSRDQAYAFARDIGGDDDTDDGLDDAVWVVRVRWDSGIDRGES